MISNLLLIAGALLLSMACRTAKSFFFRKLGTIGILFTYYLAGWLLTGYWEIGALSVATWFFLPWIQILTRINKLRLPLEKPFSPKSPPSRKDFPYLPRLTAEVESLQFDHIVDAGWNLENNHHFFRLFYNRENRCRASIAFIEQEKFAFFYIAVCSRCLDGRIYISWNYPFSYGLRLPSHFIINRVTQFSPEGVYTAHLQFMEKHSLQPELLEEQTHHALLTNIQQEMQSLVTLNLKNGLLQRDGNSLFRYSPNGLFVLWIQFLRDIVKSS